MAFGCAMQDLKGVANTRCQCKHWNMRINDGPSLGHFIIQATLLMHLCGLLLPPVVANLETGIQIGIRRMAPSTSQLNLPLRQDGSEYRTEVDDLWRDLTTISQTVSNSISSSYMSAPEVPSTPNRSLARLNGTNLSPAQNSSSADNSGSPDDELVIQAVVIANSIIFLIGFPGNFMVILIILRFTHVMSVTDFFILNLALADITFLFGLVFLNTNFIVGRWIFGSTMCRIYMSLTSLNQFASSMLLVTMSFDRFLAVCHPIYAQKFRDLKRAIQICCMIWVFCICYMIPMLHSPAEQDSTRKRHSDRILIDILKIYTTLQYNWTQLNEGSTCTIAWPDDTYFKSEQFFTIYAFCTGFAVPLILIAIFYTCVIRKLRSTAKGPINLSSRRLRSREATNRRIEYLVIAIVCTFAICWFPYWVGQMIVNFSSTWDSLDDKPVTGVYTLLLVGSCLSYLNSALNPILYAFLSDNFKRRFLDALRFIPWLKCSSNTSAQGTGTPVTSPQEVLAL